MTYRFAPAFAGINTRLRERGFRVDEVDDAPARGRRDFITMPGAIVNHHTVDRGPADYPSLQVVVNGRAKLPGPLCNYGVGRGGIIYYVAAGVANHAGKVIASWMGNPYAVGIEIANNGVGEPYSPECWAAIVALNEEITRQFDIPTARVLGHKEVCAPVGRKVDPSFHMDDLRGALGSAPAPGGVTAPVTPVPPPVVPPVTDQSRRAPDHLPVVSTATAHGDGWAKLVQKVLAQAGLYRGPIDGWIGAGSKTGIINLQARYGLTRDGAVGQQTWALGAVAVGGTLRRGEAGAAVEALQNLLGYRDAEADGEFGPGTEGRVKQVQRWAGLDADGVVGPGTRAALARG